MLVLSDQHHDRICAASPIGAGTDLRVVRPNKRNPAVAVRRMPIRIDAKPSHHIDYPVLITALKKCFPQSTHSHRCPPALLVSAIG